MLAVCDFFSKHLEPLCGRQGFFWAALDVFQLTQSLHGMQVLGSVDIAHVCLSALAASYPCPYGC